MAVVTSTLTNGFDTDGNSTATTASVSPTANSLQLIGITSRTGITADPNTPTITSTGLTWVAIASVLSDNSGASRKRFTLFRALGASPSTGTAAIDFGGQNQTMVAWTWDQASGVDTSGTNGSGAIVQFASNPDVTGTVNTLTVTLGSTPSASNLVYGAFTEGNNTQLTPGAGYTVQTYSGPSGNVTVTTEYHTTTSTSVSMSEVVNSELGGVAIEIKTTAAVATATGSTLMMMGV